MPSSWHPHPRPRDQPCNQRPAASAHGRRETGGASGSADAPSPRAHCRPGHSVRPAGVGSAFEMGHQPDTRPPCPPLAPPLPGGRASTGSILCPSRGAEGAAGAEHVCPVTAEEALRPRQGGGWRGAAPWLPPKAPRKVAAPQHRPGSDQAAQEAGCPPPPPRTESPCQAVAGRTSEDQFHPAGQAQGLGPAPSRPVPVTHWGVSCLACGCPRPPPPPPSS